MEVQFSSSVARTSKAREEVTTSVVLWRIEGNCAKASVVVVVGWWLGRVFGGVSDEPPGDFLFLEVDQLFLNLRCVKKMKLTLGSKSIEAESDLYMWLDF